MVDNVVFLSYTEYEIWQEVAKMVEKTKSYIYKNIDDMGRILIAKSIRKALGIEIGTELMFSEENGQLVIEKKKEDSLYFAPLGSMNRIVVPSELRKNLGLEIGTELEFLVEGERVTVKPKNQKCIFCEESDKLFFFFSKPVCKKCIMEIKKLAE